jgi:abortive infection bacteriophage resistance protein
MRYTKPALSFEQQAQRLIDRGLIADKATLVAHLSTVNYYRLSAYWYPFKRINMATGAECFAAGTTFDVIWRRYAFDRQLRLLLMEAVERVEIALLRTRLVEQFTIQHGPFGYVQRSSFRPEFLPDDHTRLLTEIDEAVNRSREEFVQRFRKKYTDEPHLPLWMAAEVLTFGQLFTLYRNLNRTEQQVLAKPVDLFPPVLESWLHTLNFIRNACAHHARLWNCELPIRPLIPRSRHDPDWYTPARFTNDRVFVVLTLLRYLLRRIEPQSRWQERLERLLKIYPDVPIREMGFPENWLECRIWKK